MVWSGGKERCGPWKVTRVTRGKDLLPPGTARVEVPSDMNKESATMLRGRRPLKNF